MDSLSVYENSVKECLAKIGASVVQSREDFLELFEDNFYAALAAKGINLLAFAEAALPILSAIDVGRIVPIMPVCAVVAAVPAKKIIISSNAAEAIRAVFEHWRIAAFYSDILGSEFGYSKKDKITYALGSLGTAAQPEEALYIGDTVGDIKEARAAGVATAAVTWGWHSRERLSKVKPDFLVDTPADLLKILR